MPSGYCDKADVKCPFYHGDDGSHVIVCKGLVDKSCISMRYLRKADWKIQVNTFCCQFFLRCEIFRMLINKKSEAHENE